MTKKSLTPKESDLFRQSIGDVRVIKNDKILLENKTKPKPFPKPSVFSPDDTLLDYFDQDLTTLGIEDSLSFYAPGLQKNVLKKLRNGYFGLDAEIDLHGLTSYEAKQQLLHFLHHCVENGRRCVHIVHGKGFRSPDHQPVLKNNLNTWLRQHCDVQAFCSTPPKSGGTGAVFVLLRLSEKFRQGVENEF
ncbi:MAG: Smr/MutS family protein [Methylococcaceae bacterium]|nr:Smr/MutS family protein [Methylococcaceae bacterium]